ncbi:MAG TPA: hypothetical protein PKI18_07700 [Candidatus Cloacimonas sp.]|nr:hypothetical protein [Candidatus Cloacimonas sp.]
MKIDPQKLEKYLRYFFILLTCLVIGYNLYIKEWETFWSAFMTLLLFILPTVLEKRIAIRIPTSLQIIILLFIFASMYLGEIHRYFYRFNWWDRMLHTASAVILTYSGFILIYSMNKDYKVDMKLSAKFMALFSFCFAIMICAVWEIFEYSVDSIFGVNMQKARNLEQVYGIFDTRLGVKDTMKDLIIDAISAYVVSLIGYFHLKRKKDEDSAFWGLHKQFIKDNPELFGLTENEDKIGLDSTV